MQVDEDTGAKQAHQKALCRRYIAKKATKFTYKTIRLVVERLKEKWSPEQISGWLKRIQICISHEHIYQFLLENKRKGGILYASTSFSQETQETLW